PTARIVAMNAARAESTGLWARATAGAPPPSTSAASSACLMKRPEEERKLRALTAGLADGLSCAARVHRRKAAELGLKRVDQAAVILDGAPELRGSQRPGDEPRGGVRSDDDVALESVAWRLIRRVALRIDYADGRAVSHPNFIAHRIGQASRLRERRVEG